MRVPLKVNLRGLVVRRTATIMTIAGIGLVLMVLVLVWAMSAGLTGIFRTSGDSRNLLVLRDGSGSETNSWIPRADFQVIESMSGIDAREGGGSLVSGELVVIVNQERRGSTEAANVIVRGVTQAAFDFRPELEIISGRSFTPGNKEILASAAMAGRFKGCALGETLLLRREPYEVVGLFSAPGTPFESELWTDATDLGATHGRAGYSSALVRVTDDLERAKVRQAIEGDPRLAVDVTDQATYFEQQVQSAALIQTLASLMTFFLSVGACFSAANTMYASVLARTREIGTLRALGFRRSAILLGYVVEAVVLASLAGIAGIAMGWLVLLIYGGYTGTVNWVTFSEVAFRLAVTPGVVVFVMILSAVIGAVGGFLPALRAARMPIVESLRAT